MGDVGRGGGRRGRGKGMWKGGKGVTRGQDAPDVWRYQICLFANLYSFLSNGPKGEDIL